MSRWLVLSSSLAFSLGIVVGGFLVLITSPVSVGQSLPTPIPTMAVHSVELPSEQVEAPNPSIERAGYVETVRVSYYQPWLGGPNCSRFVGGQCISRMASGLPWQDYVGRAVACPPEWNFGTLVILPGGETFECLDRGGKIKYDRGYAWIDLLVTEAPVAFGTLLEVIIIP